MATSLLLTTRSAHADDALRHVTAADSEVELQQQQQESHPYTFKKGDFTLLTKPTLGVEWNDNINLGKNNVEDDFIIRPVMEVTAAYPLTDRNVMQFNVGLGYQQYLQHSELSSWYVQSGSALSFDIFVKDFQVNLHDRFSYIQDAASQAVVTGTGDFGTLQNTVGLVGTWAIQDVALTLGYDHQNVLSTTGEFQSQNHGSELLVGRADFRVTRTLTAGLESGAGFTTYDQPILNNNHVYSGGPYVDWQPGMFLHITSRAGYLVYQFQSTSQTIKTADVNSYFVDVTATQKFSDSLFCSFSAGHETRLGIQSDVIEDAYFRPSVGWNLIRDLELGAFLSYEHGKQGAGNVSGNLIETYDWLGAGVKLRYPLLKKLIAELSYRRTIRSSSIPANEYTQNLVGLSLIYQLQ